VRPVRTRLQRTPCACALAVVLAACHRGEAPRPATEGVGGAPAAAASTTSPLGQAVTSGDEGLPPGLALRRAQGLAAMDAGRHDLAREAFAEVLEGAPGNLAAQALFDAATAAMLAAQSRAREAFASRQATRLPEPPWDYALRQPAPVEAGPPLELVLVSESRSASSEEWLARNGLALPEYEVPNPMRGDPGKLPPTIPPSFGGSLLVQAIHQGGVDLLFYGPDYAGGRFVAVHCEDTGEITALLDFEAYAGPPAERGRGEQRAQWAQLVGSTLFVSHGRAGGVGGASDHDGYITALDVTTGELLWRSAPRVAGAADFIVHAGHVFTGHGGGDAPARVVVLDARTGKAVGEARLRGGPEYLFLQSGKLLVRGDDADYVFELRHGGS
jgi:hypothetical protein